MKRKVAIAASVLALASCATTFGRGDTLTLSVLSFDRTTGAYSIRLHNHSASPAIYLDPYVVFSAFPDPAHEPFPSAVGDVALMVHETSLRAGEEVTISGQCKTCVAGSHHVALLTCQPRNAGSCRGYRPIWAELRAIGI